MMKQIIGELTAIKKTNEVTNEQVLEQDRRVDVQRAQKAFMEATKVSKDAHVMKRQEQKNNTLDRT